jgi:hypothetical protein
MRKLFPLFFICLYGAVAAAQNVGIGTSAPLNKLHIAGGLRLDTLVGVGGSGLLWHNSSGVVYGLKFTGNTNDVLRGDGSFAPSSGGGAGYWSANGNNIYNNNTGLVGIGTQTPGAGLELRGIGLQTQQRITDNTSGNSLVLQSGADDNLKITGYNYGTGIAKPLYLSVDGANTIINPHGGNVGIGTASPSFTVDIKTPTFGGGTRTISNGAANFIVQTNGGTNSWARYYMRSTNRSWFIGTSQNFNGDQLYINDETAGQTRMVINTNGKVGIGTTNPGAGLEVSGTALAAQQRITDNTSGNSLVLQGGSGNNMKITGYNYGSNTAVPLHLSTDGANTVLNSGGGNVLQPGAGYGVPKAMVYVLANGTISRCYNGITGTTTGGCGFSVSVGGGLYDVNLGFDLSQRFFSVVTSGNLAEMAARIASIGSTTLTIRTFSTFEDVNSIPSDFFLIVY